MRLQEQLALAVAANLLNIPELDLTSWLSPERLSVLSQVSMPSSMSSVELTMALESPERVTEEFLLQWEASLGHPAPALHQHAEILSQMPSPKLQERRTFFSDGAVAQGALSLSSSLSSNGSLKLLEVLGITCPSSAMMFPALAIFDGLTTVGWSFERAELLKVVVERVIFFQGAQERAVIEVMLRQLLLDAFEGANAQQWSDFAGRTLSLFRPGEAGYSMTIKVIRLMSGELDAIVVEYHVLPIKLAISAVQAFNLSTARLEDVGLILGAFNIAPADNGTQWVSALRLRYGREGLGVELGFDLPAH